jgi:hypothetical protein
MDGYCEIDDKCSEIEQGGKQVKRLRRDMEKPVVG